MSVYRGCQIADRERPAMSGPFLKAASKTGFAGRVSRAALCRSKEQQGLISHAIGRSSLAVLIISQHWLSCPMPRGKRSTGTVKDKIIRVRCSASKGPMKGRTEGNAWNASCHRRGYPKADQGA